jgi:hypothetical protein
LIENRDKQDGIRSWCQLVQQYDTDGNRNVRIKRLESFINTVFHRNIGVEMSSILRTDPEVYYDKKQKHLKRFHSKVVTKIELINPQYP